MQDTRTDRNQGLEYYLNLQYPVQLSQRDDDGEPYWFAEILELPGCMADGETPDETIGNLQEAKRLWMESCLEDGHQVPVPAEPHAYSGKLLVRLPKSLHRTLATEARREGTSLNQYVVSLLAGQSNADQQLREIRSTVDALAKQVAAANARSAVAIELLRVLQVGAQSAQEHLVDVARGGTGTALGSLSATYYAYLSSMHNPVLRVLTNDIEWTSGHAEEAWSIPTRQALESKV